MNEEVKCPHEDNITYGELYQEDGEPQYNVTCDSCGATGRIMLVEDENIWEVQDETSCMHNFNDGICKTCGEVQNDL